MFALGGTGELREIMADSARLDAYLSAKQHADASVVGSSVPNLSELPTKLSALSDILEEAGATDDDVEEVRKGHICELRP